MVIQSDDEDDAPVRMPAKKAKLNDASAKFKPKANGGMANGTSSSSSSSAAAANGTGTGSGKPTFKFLSYAEREAKKAQEAENAEKVAKQKEADYTRKRKEFLM